MYLDTYSWVSKAWNDNVTNLPFTFQFPSSTIRKKKWNDFHNYWIFFMKYFNILYYTFKLLGNFWNVSENYKIIWKNIYIEKWIKRKMLHVCCTFLVKIHNSLLSTITSLNKLSLKTRDFIIGKVSNKILENSFYFPNNIEFQSLKTI